MRPSEPATPLRVGLVGAGRIARTGILPAYAVAGIPLVAICSKTRASAEEAAERWTGAGRVRVHADLEDLAADPSVELIEVATPPHDRLAMLRRLIAVGKPLLVHKPLAYDQEEAYRIVAEAEDAGVPIAVNHNARWWPVQRILSAWLRNGDIGDVVHLANVHHFSEDVRTWYTDREDYLFIEHGIHFLDLARRYLGEPISVAARAARVPGQQARCWLGYTVMLRFGGPEIASLTLYNATRSPSAWDCHWFVNGTRADAHLTYSAATLYPGDGEAITERPEGTWIPDGLAAAYWSFVTALRTGGRPPHDAADHLRTLALSAAATASARADGAWMDVSGSDLEHQT